jgi:N-acetylglutamate synthase-like GNAT family acetyltransferase
LSDEQIDELAESARNRELKLVRSRVRTPGKRRFGRVGLTDASGKPVFGMDEAGPDAKPEDVQHYLRNLGAKDWGASLDVAVLPRKKPKKARQGANDAGPEPAPREKRPAPPPPRPKPPPSPKIREARPADAKVLAKLIRYLGHEIDDKSVRRNLAKLAKARETPLVATLKKKVVGLVGFHTTVTVHRPAPVGRITILVVAEDAQDKGIGRMLVAEAEKRLRKSGCRIVEVTSNDRRTAAHAFYRHLGYERTSMRFMKTL